MNKFRPIVLGILFLYLQVFMADNLQFMQIIPNLLLPFTVFINFKYPLNLTSVTILFVGLSVDLLSPLTLGLNTFLLIVIGFLVNRFNQAVNKKSSSYLISILFLNFIYYAGFVIMQYSFKSITPSIILNVLISSLFNSAVSIILLSILFFSRHLKIELEV